MSTPHMPLLNEPDTIPTATPAPVMHELDSLRDAVRSLERSIRRLESASLDAAHPQLITMFDMLARLRAVGVDEIRQAAAEDGLSIPEAATPDVSGRMRRTIVGLTSALLGDRVLLTSTAKADEKTLSTLQQVLGEDLPDTTRSAVESAAAAVRATILQTEDQLS